MALHKCKGFHREIDDRKQIFPYEELWVEFRNTEINRNSWSFLQFSEWSDFDAKIQVIDFSVESGSTVIMFSSETLSEEIEPLVSEKFELKYRKSRDKKYHVLDFSNY